MSAVNTVTGYTVTATMTNAEFRAIGLFFATVMQSGGFTKTVDTGQIDWTTVNFPGVNSTTAGYEIRGFTDAMQGSAPLYFKISYRRGAGTSIFEIGVSIGTGTDGVGNLTGVRQTETLHNIVSGTIANLTLRAQASQWGMIWFTYDNVSTSFWFNIERTFDQDAALDALGCNWLHSSQGSATCRHVPRTGTVPAAENMSAAGFTLMPIGTTGLNASTSNINVFTIHPHGDGGGVQQPFQNLVVAYATNFATANGEYQITVRGTPTNMINPPAASLPGHSIGGATAASSRWMMRYE